MNAANFWFGMDLGALLPELLADELMDLDKILGVRPRLDTVDGFQRETFYPDGTPVNHNALTVYPYFAPRYLGTPMPDANVRLEEGYSRTAAKSAVSWVCGLLGGMIWEKDLLHGIRMDVHWNGSTVPVMFPLCGAELPDGEIIFPVADTWRNDGDWGQGAVPAYIEQQVRFLLWCYRQAGLPVPTQVYVARIIGNLPTDMSVCTLFPDAKKEDRIASRVLNAVTKTMAAGKSLLSNTNIIPETPWEEAKAAALAECYQTDDPQLFELVQKYMAARSVRKELEAEDKRLKKQTDAIAINLAAQIDGANSRGELILGKTAYRVSHATSRKSDARITPGLIYQYAPQLAATALKEGPGKVTVSVDVL